MNTWESGWRKLVEWDRTEKVYKYKDHTILPLSFQEQLTMPLHLQNEYYWNEINYIDKRLNSNIEEDKAEWCDDVEKALNELFNYWEK